MRGKNVSAAAVNFISSNRSAVKRGSATYFIATGKME
jgi:hypothetical protein